MSFINSEITIELWLDGLEKDSIVHANELGFLHGVTTNPRIIASNKQNQSAAIKEVLKLFDGPLAVQVTSFNADTMIAQAKELREISNRIIIKIPCLQSGYKAMGSLTKLKIPVMATAIYTLRQYLLASFYGVEYAAPYFSRIIKNLENSPEMSVTEATFQAHSIVQQMVELSHQSCPKVLVAAIKNPSQMDALIKHGSYYMTVAGEVLTEFLEDNAKTSADTKEFIDEWNLEFKTTIS